MTVTLPDVLAIILLIAGILALMVAVHIAGKRWELTAEARRKLVHVATGSAALTFPLVFSSALPVFILTALAAGIMMVLRNRQTATDGLGSVLHDVKRRSYGEIYLAVAIAYIFYRAEGAPVLFVLPVLVITLSDTASALIGTSYGRKRFAVADGSKSLEGVVAFFVVTWLCAMITLLLMTDAPRVNVILLSLLIAAFCALVEADSWAGLDNLFVPIGAHLLLATHLEMAPIDLAVVAVVFLAALTVMLLFAPYLNLSAHSARAYTVLLFLIFSMVAPQNMLMPILAIGAQICARSQRPAKDSQADLNFLALSAGVGMMWLLAGEFLGQSGINLFNLTFAAAALIYFGLAMLTPWRPLLLVGIPVLGVVLLKIGDINGRFGPSIVPDWVVVAVALTVPVLVVLVKPEAFSKMRSPKVFVLALIVPLAAYVKGAAGL
ncbi:MAG: hypothetical protein ABJN26_09045 [Stappiaceae bacterium]